MKQLKEASALITQVQQVIQDIECHATDADVSLQYLLKSLTEALAHAETLWCAISAYPTRNGVDGDESDDAYETAGEEERATENSPMVSYSREAVRVAADADVDLPDIERMNEADPILSTEELATSTNSGPQEIRHAWEEGVLTLQPTFEQWNNFPAVLATAAALGAASIGAFKVRILGEVPEAYRYEPQPCGRRVSCSTYSLTRVSDGVHRISMPPANRVLSRSRQSDNNSAISDLLERQRQQLENGRLDGVCYQTDQPCRTSKHRDLSSVPKKSLIWPLGGNKLDQTKFAVPGIHWPYSYRSGAKFGALFLLHLENWNLHSLSYLYEGRKLWICIPPSARELFEKTYSKATGIKLSSCQQWISHQAIYMQPLKLDSWRIPYHIVDQRAGEIVVTLPETYHEGFSTGFTLAEAVNYADKTWSPSGYPACKPECPIVPISDKQMSIRNAGEIQREEDDEGREEDKQGQDKTVKESASNVKGKSRPNPIPRAKIIPRTRVGAEPEQPSSQTILPFIPVPSEIGQLVDYAVRQIKPDLLGCDDSRALRESLSRFMPPGRLDRNLLVHLLRTICNSARFHVYHGQLEDLPAYIMHDYEGVVGLVSPNSTRVVDLDATDPPCWAIVACNWSTETFWAYGLEDNVVQHYLTLAEEYTSMSLTVIPPQKQEPNDLCDGMRCCLALECYLGRNTKKHDHRTRYLSMLLTHYLSYSQLSHITGIWEEPISLTTAIPSFEIEQLGKVCGGKHYCLQVDFGRNYRDALDDDRLGLERKARLLQMIMQCTSPSLSEVQVPRKDTRLQELVAQLKIIRSRTSECNFIQRCVLVQIALHFNKEVEKIDIDMKQQTKIRNRDKNSTSQRLGTRRKGRGPTARTKALNKLSSDACDINELTRLVNIGNCLLRLCERLGGILVLTVLPSEDIYHNNARLQVSTGKKCFQSLAKPIVPSEYHLLTDKELDFFTEWLPKLNGAACAQSLDSEAVQVFLSSASELSKQIAGELLEISPVSKRARLE